MGRKKRVRKRKLLQILPDLLNVYRYFWNDIRKQIKLIVISFLALLCGVVFRLLEPWPLKFVLDQVFEKSSATATVTLPQSWSASTIVLTVSLAVIVIAAMRATTDYISRVGFFNVGNKIVIRVRNRVYRHLQKTADVVSRSGTAWRPDHASNTGCQFTARCHGDRDVAVAGQFHGLAWHDDCHVLA